MRRTCFRCRTREVGQFASYGEANVCDQCIDEYLDVHAHGHAACSGCGTTDVCDFFHYRGMDACDDCLEQSWRAARTLA